MCYHELVLCKTVALLGRQTLANCLQVTACEHQDIVPLFCGWAPINQYAYYGRSPCYGWEERRANPGGCRWDNSRHCRRCEQRLARKLERLARRQAEEEERAQEGQSSQSAGDNQLNGLPNSSTEKEGGDTTVGSPEQERQDPPRASVVNWRPSSLA